MTLATLAAFIADNILSPHAFLLYGALLALWGVKVAATRLRVGVALIALGLMGADAPNVVPLPVALTNAALAAYPASTFLNIPILRVGFTTPGDVPPVWWSRQTGLCAAQVPAMVSDGGSCQNGSDGNSFAAVVPGDGIDIRQWGVKFDNSTDNSTALQSAFTWMATGRKIKLPGLSTPAKFGTGITFNLPASVTGCTLEGSGSRLSILAYTGTGFAISGTWNSQQNTCRFAGFDLTTNGAGTASGILLTSTVLVLGTANQPQNLISDVGLYGSDGGLATNYFATAIKIVGVDDVTLLNDFVAGSGTRQGIGVDIHAASNACCAVVYNIIGGSYESLANGVQLNSWVQTVTIQQTNIGATNPIFVPASQTNIAQVNVNMVDFANSAILFGAGSCVTPFTFTNNVVELAVGATGVNIATDCGTMLSGNFFTPLSGAPTGTGISLGTVGSFPGTFITGNSFVGLSSGVTLGAGETGAKLFSNHWLSNTVNITNNSTSGSNTIGSPANWSFGSLATPGALAAATTYFCVPGGCNTTEGNAEVPLRGGAGSSFAGETGVFYVDFLDVWLSSAPGGAVTTTATFRCGAVDTALTVAITGAVQSVSDNVHNVSCADGALSNLHVVTGAAANTAVLNGSVRIGINP